MYVWCERLASPPPPYTPCADVKCACCTCMLLQGPFARICTRPLRCPAWTHSRCAGNGLCCGRLYCTDMLGWTYWCGFMRNHAHTTMSTACILLLGLLAFGCGMEFRCDLVHQPTHMSCLVANLSCRSVACRAARRTTSWCPVCAPTSRAASASWRTQGA